MKLLDIRQFERFVHDRSVKVLRHKDSKYDLWLLRRAGKFGKYQNGQSWDVFGSAKHIISFIAERHSYAKFVGVWEVISKRKKRNRYSYRTREVSGFESLAGRLIVRWGTGTRSWGQWLHRQGNKEIVEIQPPNYVDFPGYYNVALSYEELGTVIRNPDSNREWQRMLSAVSGVYLYAIGSMFGQAVYRQRIRCRRYLGAMEELCEVALRRKYAFEVAA